MHGVLIGHATIVHAAELTLRCISSLQSQEKGFVFGCVETPVTVEVGSRKLSANFAHSLSDILLVTTCVLGDLLISQCFLGRSDNGCPVGKVFLGLGLHDVALLLGKSGSRLLFCHVIFCLFMILMIRIQS